MAKVLVSDKLSDAGLQSLRSFSGIELEYKPGLKPGLKEDELPFANVARVGFPHGINLSRMQLGLDEKTGRALSLCKADSTVPDAAIEALRKIEFVRSVNVVEL